MVDPVTPTVTVVLTTYNHEPYIAQAIRSVMEQRTQFPFELVVLDDCSTDRTAAIVAALAHEHGPKMRAAFGAANRNDNRAFMKAIDEAASPFVAFLDGDDYWTSADKLQRQVDFLATHGDCVVSHHNMTLLYDDGTAPRNSLPDDQLERASLADILDHCFISLSSAMIRRDAIARWPAHFADDECPDWTMFVLAATRGNLGCIRDVLGVYRQHGGGFWTGQTSVTQRQRVVRFYERLLPLLSPPYDTIARRRAAKESFELGYELLASGDGSAADAAWRRARLFDPDVRRSTWELRCAGGNRACLSFPDDHDGVALKIERIVSPSVFDLQLNVPHRSVTAGERYAVSCRARSSRSREAWLGVAHATAPWSNLGLYTMIPLTREWRDLHVEFIATESTANARLHFDVGGNEADVEIASAELDPALGVHP